MEYVSLEERILTECKDQDKEYLVKKCTTGFLGLFYALKKEDAALLAEYLKSGKTSFPLNPLLSVIPLILRNGKSFETDKVITSIKNINSGITEKILIDTILLFSYTFDLLYGTSIEDTLDNLNCLAEDCMKRFKDIEMPILDTNSVKSIKSDFNSLIILKEYIAISNLENYLEFNFANDISKSISLFIKGIVSEEKNTEYGKIENEYGDVIRNFLISI